MIIFFSWFRLAFNIGTGKIAHVFWAFCNFDYVAFPKIFFPIVVNFYLVVSFETSDEGLHVGNFVMETDRIWVHRIAIGKSGITVKKKKKKKLENRKEN